MDATPSTQVEQLTDHQKAILVGIHDAVKFWRGYQLELTRNGSLRLRVQDAEEGLVKPEPRKWIGVDVGNHAGRIYKRLEQLGLVDRFALGRTSMCTHLALTRDGRKMVKRLLAK